MRALVYTGPETLEIRDVADPQAAEGDILLDVSLCGICGSDMHAYLGHDDRRPAPLILGHEAVGVASGGKRYAVNPLVTCGESEACRDGRDNLCADRQIISMPPREGAFAEKLAMPAGNLVELPEHAEMAAAALTEPLACGWHAVRLAAEVSKRHLEETTCLAIGGGAIGLGAALALRAQGARDVWLAETSPIRRALLKDVDGVRCFDPDCETAPAPDIIVDGVGIAPTRAYASEIVKPGGVIAHIGLGSAEGGLDIRRMTLQEIAFFGTYTYAMSDFRETAQAIFDGRMGDLSWVKIMPLDAGPAAFSALRKGEVANPKVLLAM